ncbi:MAG TPA: trigger factor [Verrucomicrobiales bacterium]|nr:trigger factor [Verrucomicrobiales bacterium]
MTITIERKPRCRALVRAEIPAEGVEEARRRILRDLVQRAKIPGFRKGKTPRRVLEQRFGKQVAHQLETKLAEQILRKAEDIRELSILKALKVSASQGHADGSWSMVVEVLTNPSFELPNYKGIPLQVPPLEVDPAAVDEVLEMRRKERADYEDLPAGTPLEMGRFAVVDYEGFIEGAPLVDRLTAEARYFAQRADTWFKLEEEIFLPGFAEGLVGHQAGENVQVRIVLPEDFAFEDLRGHEVEYAVAIKAVKEERLPSLESIAEDVPGGLEELRTLVSSQLAQAQLDHRQRALESGILEYLHRAVDFELPPEVVSAHAQRNVDKLVRHNQSMGVPEEVIRGQEEAIVEAAGKRARQDLKTEFILSEIGRIEGIEVTPEQLRREVNEIAEASGMSHSKAMQRLERNGGLRQVAQTQFFRNVVDFLVAEANITVEEAEGSTPPPAS